MSEGKQRILIVDDMPENIDILVTVLKDEYAVLAARDGEKGLALARGAQRPDLILLDIMMPKMDGYAVCAALKSSPDTATIPVIFITALNGDEEEARGLALGAVDFINKPFNPYLVRARVANHLELKAHRDHLEQLVEERTHELSVSQEVTLYSLATLAETRDQETGSHIRRTQAYVKLLAEELQKLPQYAQQLTPETIDLLYLSAPLHDIGKVGVPDAILHKPGKLTAEEFEAIKRHPDHGRNALRLGAERLGSSSLLHVAEEIAWTHHEKWDGTGYPRGLRGSEIPLAGRLMALADVYDALITRRPYKKPYSHEVAIEFITKGRGTQFDPEVVDAFLRVHEAFRRVAREYSDLDECEGTGRVPTLAHG